MASAVIGALRVNLGLDSAQFQKGMSDSRSSMLSFAAKAGSIVGTAVGGVKSAMVAMGLSAINSAAEIENLSRVANTTPETFQGWAAGAKTVGIEQDKLADILKDVNDKAGEFVSTGGGQMKDFFQNIAPKVGVTAEQFRTLSGPEALQLYVDSLQKAGLNQQQMTFYMEAIADEATALIPLLKDNGAGMASYAAQAQAVGAIMDSKMIASLHRGKIALVQMDLAVTGMRNTIGAQAVPAVVALSAAVTAAAEFFRTHADTIMTVMRTLAGSVAVIAALFAGRYAIAVGVTAVRAMVSAVTQSIALEVALGAQSKAAAVASVTTKALAGAMGLLRGAILSTGIGILVVGAGYLVGRFTELVSATGGFGNALSLLGDVAAGVWSGISESAKAIPLKLAAHWESVKSGFFDMVASLMIRWKGFLESLSGSLDGTALQGLSDAMKARADALAGTIEDYNRSASDAQVHSEQLAASASGALSTGFGAAKDALARLNVTVDDANTGLGTLGGAGGGLAAVATGAKTAKEKLSDLQRVMKRLRDQNEELNATAGMTDTQAEIWKNQKEAGVSAGSSSGQEIANLTTMNDRMQTLKDATKEWQQSISSAFGSFLSGASSFKDALGQIIGKLGEMALNSAFQGLFASSSGWMGSVLSGLGIGANANGTDNWRGGLTAINERGNEIVNLPNGTQIIPHDVSMRMADAAGSASGGASAMHVTVGFDDTGNLYVRQVAQQEAASAVAKGSKALPVSVQKANANPRRR